MLNFRSFMTEGEDGPCWKGYKAIGTKKKKGKTVPNCVPESIEEARKPHPQPRAAGSVPQYSQKEKDRINVLAKRPINKLAKPPKYGMRKEEVEQVDELTSRRQLSAISSNLNDVKNTLLSRSKNKNEKTSSKSMSYRAHFMKKAMDSHDAGNYDDRDKAKRSSRAWKQ